MFILISFGVKDETTIAIHYNRGRQQPMFSSALITLMPSANPIRFSTFMEVGKANGNSRNCCGSWTRMRDFFASVKYYGMNFTEYYPYLIRTKLDICITTLGCPGLEVLIL